MNTAQIFFRINEGKFEIIPSDTPLTVGVHRIQVHHSVTINGTYGNDLTVIFIEILNESQDNGTIQ